MKKCIFLISLLIIPFVSALLPILGNIAKDAIGTFGQIGKKIHSRLNERQREGQLNPAEKFGVVRDALIEDYVENHGKRVNRFCEYLKAGKIYRGPCVNERGQEEENEASESRQVYGEGRGAGGRRGNVVKEEITIIENPRGRGHRRGHGRGHRGGHGRGGGNRGRPRGFNGPGDVIKEEITIIERPRPKPVVIDDGNYRVQPETVVEEEEVVEKPRPRPPGKPNRGQSKNGAQQNLAATPCQTNDGFNGVCMPPAYCYVQYSGIEDYRLNICDLGNHQGICCPKEGNRAQVDTFELIIRIPSVNKPLTKIQFISLEDINTAAKDADKFIQSYIKQETDLIRKGMVQKKGSMSSLHQAFFGDFDPVQFQLTKGGFINLLSTMMIMKKFNLKKNDARDGLYKYSIENTDLEKFCIKEPTCHQGKYRTMDGSCNNLQRPLWGRANTAFERILPPEYDDGLHEPKSKSVTGNELPSARLVSSTLAPPQNAPDPKYTLMVMQMGQFLDHDLTLAASTRAATGQGLACCDDRTQTPVKHHACFPIIIPRNDPFYSTFNQRCMHLVRSSPAPRSGCSLGHREQMNTLTHVVDASMVYGSSSERTKILREFRNGKMKSSFIGNLQFLPFEHNNRSDDCGLAEQELRQFKCFVAGDVRVNEQSGLTMMHNLFLREHNRIADILKTINKRWDDEILFQETRRILIAEIQHITYNEWLPIIIGRTVMKHFHILPKPFGFSKDYNPRVNPNIVNEFASAAYRLHSLVQGTFSLRDNEGKETVRLSLHELFNKPKSLFLPNAFDQYLNGFTIQPAQSWDHFFTDSLTKQLFTSGNGFGMDLISLNIQRGRDHGLPGYNAYRKVCGMRTLQSFRELEEVMDEGASQHFSRVYQHVDDIDLFIAGSYEKPLEDGLVGPTFACIIAEQFRRSKIGDRFWYENGGLPHSFSEAQLNEIRKVSLASLICENGDTIPRIQPLAFLRPEGWNKRTRCDQIARMNLNAWKNERIW